MRGRHSSETSQSKPHIQFYSSRRDGPAARCHPTYEVIAEGLPDLMILDQAALQYLFVLVDAAVENRGRRRTRSCVRGR